MEQGKVLVIDDEKDLIDLLEEFLTGAGYQVRSASNGKEALKVLEKFQPDLIILDLIMPKGSGISFYHSITRSSGTPRYPVMILTGRNEYESVFADLQIDGFMTKPFKIPELLGTVKAIIQKRHPDAVPPSSYKSVKPLPAVQKDAPKAATEPPQAAPRFPSHFQKNTIVRDIMTTHVLAAHAASSTLGLDERPSDKVSHVVDLLQRHKIRHMPVVDSHQKLVGLISEDNILRHVTPKLGEEGYVFDPVEIDQLILEHIMTKDPVYVHPGDPISRVTNIMAAEKYGAVPVVDQEMKLVGIISQIDLLKLLSRWLDAA